MDARSITEMRTAAVSAAVTRYAMPPKRACWQSQVAASKRERTWPRSRTSCRFERFGSGAVEPEHASRFADECGGIAMGARNAVEAADVVVVATSSREPVLRGAWLEAGAHVNSVGANRSTWRELDDDAMRETLLVDSREAVAVESGATSSGRMLRRMLKSASSSPASAHGRNVRARRFSSRWAKQSKILAAAKLVLENHSAQERSV